MLAAIEGRAHVYCGIEKCKAIREDRKIGFEEHISILITIAADGTYIKPLVIVPLVYLPDKADTLLEFYDFAGQSSGWMTKTIFEQWTVESFVLHVKAKRKSLNLPDNQKAILYADNHASRTNSSMLDILKANNIELVTFPPHTTHCLQPIDRRICGPFKSKLKSKMQFAKELGNKTDRRIQLLQIGAKSLYESLFFIDVIESFRVTGLYPFSLINMLDFDRISTSSSTNIDSNDQTEATKAKKVKLSIDDRVLTSDKYLAELKEKEAARAIKVAKKRSKSKKQNLEA